MGNASACLALPALLLTAAGLLGGPALAETGTHRETLADLLSRERIDFKTQHPEDLGKLISNGSEQETEEVRIVATYLEEGGRLGDQLFVFRLAKARGT